MPRYRVVDGFCLGGAHGDVYPGDSVTLDEKEAAVYVQQGRLVVDDSAPAPAPAKSKPAGDAGKA